jgi:hypothetical protein
MDGCIRWARFELIAGQNADTTTKAHTARITWNRSWSAATVTDLSAGFYRVHSPTVPEPNTVGPWISLGAVLDPLGPVRIVFTMPARYSKAAGTPGPAGRSSYDGKSMATKPVASMV